jgi:hypothetical protein
MKTTVFRIACAIIVLTAGFTAKAQEPFFDTKWNNGKVETRTMYVMGYSGLYERNTVSEYTYNEAGDFVMKEVFVWKSKYVWNDKRAVWIPDYSKETWIPDHRILRTEDKKSNVITFELLTWNSWKKEYDPAKEKMIYQSYNPNRFTYLAYQKGNRYTEWVKGEIDKELFAEF